MAKEPPYPQAEAKRAIIVKQLISGRPVAIQETHWTTDCEAVWTALFPGARLYSSPARKGPRGGPQGGVAVLVPDSWQERNFKIHVSGCCVDVTAINHQGDVTRIINVYAPPDSRTEVLEAISESRLTPPEERADQTYLVGDFNLDLHFPRGPGEQRDVEKIQEVTQCLGLNPISEGKPTYAGYRGSAAIDHVFADKKKALGP